MNLRAFLDDKVRRYRWEKRWWQLNLLVAVYLFVWQHAVWQVVSVFYLILVSIYALVITAGGAEQAARAAKESAKQPEDSQT